MRIFLALVALALLWALPEPAAAQQVNLYCWVSAGPPTQWAPCSSTNPMQITGSFSATTTGFPGTTQTTGTPIAVTTGGVTGTLPAGAVVVASNVGATNNAYCKLGASASVNDQLIPPSAWFAFTVGSNTQLTCITSTSTTTVNMVGGAGLPTGAGGGGGGGGGSVTQGTSPWVDSVYGPTASGSASANPPVQIGGTITGAAGQNVAGVAVKPASTAAVATDTSLVTQLNPNSPGIIAAAVPGTPNNAQVVSVQGETGMTPVVTTSATTGGALPNGALAIQGNGTGSTGAVVGTLAAASSKTTYLCDFDVSALGTASSIGPIVVAGLLGGSKTYQMGTLATGTQQILNKNFNPCLPGSGVNTAITITTTADATATAVDVNSSGYQQ